MTRHSKLNHHKDINQLKHQYAILSKRMSSLNAKTNEYEQIINDFERQNSKIQIPNIIKLILNIFPLAILTAIFQNDSNATPYLVWSVAIPGAISSLDLFKYGSSKKQRNKNASLFIILGISIAIISLLPLFIEQDKIYFQFISGAFILLGILYWLIDYLISFKFIKQNKDNKLMNTNNSISNITDANQVELNIGDNNIDLGDELIILLPKSKIFYPKKNNNEADSVKSITIKIIGISQTTALGNIIAVDLFKSKNIFLQKKFQMFIASFVVLFLFLIKIIYLIFKHYIPGNTISCINAGLILNPLILSCIFVIIFILIFVHIFAQICEQIRLNKFISSDDPNGIKKINDSKKNLDNKQSINIYKK